MLEKFTTFGDLLRYLRRRIGLTQMELSIAVGYSDAQISRLERNLRLPDIATIQARFIPALDLDDELEAAGKLLELAANVRREDSPASGLCPYKGLNYFEEVDADLFVGREALTEKLVERIFSTLGNLEEREPRFLAVVGASGSGKSSLLRAGLVPALRWDKKSAEWHIHTITPTAHPLESLAIGLTEDQETVSVAADLMDNMAQDPRSLHLFASRRLAADKNNFLLLVIDQFEELFTLCHSERERASFIKNLIKAASEVGGQVIVLIALRADFYAHCANYLDLRKGLAKQQEYIGAMTLEELRRAIEEPAQRGRWELEPGLVDLLLHDVGDEPGALPLLSHALLETWQRRRGRTLTLSGYTSSGGVHGAIAETAESVYVDQLTKQQQSIARRIFLRLTEFGDETSATDTRRRVKLDELVLRPEEASSTIKVLQKLADARLISTTTESVEVAHEALIREWPTLQGWLEENREGLHLHRQLTEAAQEWKATDCLPDLLHRGVRLAKALDWASSHDDEMNPLEREFLEASSKASENRAAEREAQRQRELEAARQLAKMESQRAEDQAQAADQLQKRAVYLTAAFLIALILAVTALFFGSQARQAAGQARNIALIAGSQAAFSKQDTDTAIALAMQAVAFNPDSSLAQAQLSEVAYAPGTVRVLKGNKDIATWIAVSPDDETLLAGVDDGSIILWQLATGELLWETKFDSQVGESWVQDVGFSHDGQIAAATYDDRIVLLQAETGQLIRQIDSIVNRQKIAFNPAGSQFATVGSEEQSHLVIWDIPSGEAIRDFQAGSSIEDLVYTNDGSAILIASQTGMLTLIDSQTGQTIREFQEYLGTNPGRLHYIAIDHDGSKVIAASYGTEMLPVWSFETGELVERFSYAGVWSAAFHPQDGTILIGDHNVLRTIDQESGAVVRANSGHESVILNLAVTSDGALAITTGVDETIRVWDLQGGQVLRQLSGPQAVLSDISLSPDGRQLVVGSADGSVTLWDVETGQEIGKFVDDQPVTAVTFSPDGRKVLIGEGYPNAEKVESGHVVLWGVETGEEIRRFEGQPYAVEAVAFSPDGRLAASAGEGAMMILWDVETGGEIQRFEEYWVDSPWGIETYWDVEFSPDGKRIFASHTSQEFDSHSDGAIIGWDVNTGEQIQQLIGHSELALSLRFSNNGQQLVSGGLDSQIILWDVDTGNIIRRLSTNTGGISRLEFSPDETFLMSSGYNGTTSLWRLASSEEIRRFGGGLVSSLQFTPDGRHAVVGYQDGGIELWRLDSTLEELISWVRNERYIPDLTCEQREFYRIKPLCDKN